MRSGQRDVGLPQRRKARTAHDLSNSFHDEAQVRHTLLATCAAFQAFGLVLPSFLTVVPMNILAASTLAFFLISFYKQ